MRLSAHVLVKQPEQLPGRLWGHLRDKPQPEMQSLLCQAEQVQTLAWLRPDHGNLTVPDGPLRRTFSGHSHWVNSVAISPDGKRVVSGSYDNMLKVWDLDSGECLATFCGDHAFLSCSIAPDGRTIVAGDAEGRVHFFQLIND